MGKDRLSQIWDGFSRHTAINLSGTNVRTTQRPTLERPSQELTPRLAQPLRVTEMPEGTTDPVGAALSAMHTQMSASPKQGRANTRRDHGGAAVGASLPPLPPSNVEKTLLADLAFTQSKTSRGETDYLTYAAERQMAWQRRKRKKFLGIF